MNMRLILKALPERLGDMTSHGGRLTVGLPHVQIGQPPNAGRGGLREVAIQAVRAPGCGSQRRNLLSGVYGVLGPPLPDSQWPFELRGCSDETIGTMA